MPPNPSLVEQKELSAATVLREVSGVIARRPWAILSLSLPIVILRLIGLWLDARYPVPHEGMAQMANTVALHIGYNFALDLLALVPIAALTFIVFGEFAGEPVTLSQALARVTKLLARLVGNRIIYSVVGFFLLLLLVIPGAIWFLRGTFWMLIVLTDPNTVGDPFDRSAALMKGRYAHFIWLALMFGLLVVGPFIAMQELGLTTLSAVMQVFCDLFWDAGVVALLFWHARQRVAAV